MRFFHAFVFFILIWVVVQKNSMASDVGADHKSDRQTYIAKLSALLPGTIFDDCHGAGWCPSMVVVPKGSFMMGSNMGLKDEKPVHRVTIREPFAVGRFEVTWDEWEACVDESGCDNKPIRKVRGDNGWGKGQNPVIHMSWNDAKAYLKWLSKKTGKRYRLLSEAEWEYVARGNMGSRKYWWGSTVSHDYANYGKDRCCGGLRAGRDKWKNTSPVGSFIANPFKVHDMQGNVWEWVEDCYGLYKDTPIDGRAYTAGSCNHRGLRGGSWNHSFEFLRSASRFWFSPELRSSYNGFRVARDLPESGTLANRKSVPTYSDNKGSAGGWHRRKRSSVR